MVTNSRPAHFCHVPGCGAVVPRRHLMCSRCWRLVPIDLRNAVWHAYAPGQEDGKHRVTRQYVRAARTAIEHVVRLRAKGWGK